MTALRYRDITRFLIGLSAGLVLALVIAVNTVLIWVATGPRSLDKLTPYVEQAFRSDEQGISISVGKTELRWGNWYHPINIHLQNVSVLTKDKVTFSTFPEILLGVDLWTLPFGKVLPTALTINHPVISLLQNEDRSVSFGLRHDDAPAADTAAAPPPESTATPETPAATDATAEQPTIPFAAVLGPLLSPNENGSLRKLRYITILDADVSVGRMGKGVLFKANNANIIFKRSRDGEISTTASATMHYDTYESLVTSQFTFDSAAIINGSITFGQLMPGTLVNIFSANNLLSALKFPISGKVNLILDKAGTLEHLVFAVDGGKGTIENDQLAAPLNVTSMHTEGQLSDNAGVLQIDRLNMNLDGPVLAAQGKVVMQNSDVAVTGDASLTDVPNTDVRKFWLPSLAPMTREWIIGNISGGKISKAGVKVNIAMGDLAKPMLPREAIDASVALEGAKIRYIPEHPEVENVNAVIHVDGLGMTADIASADYMKDTKLSNGKLAIDDLVVDNPYIKLSFDAATSAGDMVRFLGLPRLEHAKHLGLDTASAAGSVKGTAAVGFYFFAPKDEKGKSKDDGDISYDITAHLAGVSQAGFMKKFDIKDAAGDMTINNQSLSFKGNASVNGAAVSNSEIKYLFKPEQGFDTFIQAEATAPIETLPRFGYPNFAFAKGSIGVKANVKLGDKAESSRATIDLTNTALKLDDFNWVKPDKEPAMLELTAEKKDGVLTLPQLRLQGKNLNVAGSALLDKDMVNFKQVDLKPVQMGATKLASLSYRMLEGGGYGIDASGESADLTGWMKPDPDPKAESTFSFAKFPALQLKLDVGRMILGEGREFAAVKGEVDCDSKLCKSANVSGKLTDGKNFNFRILRNPKGKRQLSLHAESAGVFLKTLNIHDGVDGGDLSLTGSYNDTVSPGKLTGRLNITEHVVKQAPILARILSLASFTGFFDTLQGKGIRFTRLNVPFTLSNDVITLEKARTYGDAMGLTAEGTVTFPKRTLDIKGTIVPSYTLNNVLGKVPLVGDLLTGGDGQGVFAASYTITGTEKEPDVSVNPLSMLAPGFLRSIFDSGDAPDKPADDD